MAGKNLWLMTLCLLLMISVSAGLNVWLRIAIAANACVILFDVIKKIKELTDDRKTKDYDIHSG